MPATAIVRRIDDLGRVVIPKEIRRSLRIRVGDPLEIFVNRDDEIILQKYSPINELGDFATEYVEALYESLRQAILICDQDEYIATAGVAKKDYVYKSISAIVERAITNRQPVLNTSQGNCTLVDDAYEEVSSCAIVPIIADGDAVGAVVIFSKTTTVADVEMKAIETAASFLGRCMEE